MSDWRKDADYPTQLPAAQWRWQFLRRHAGYRDLWTRVPKRSGKRVLVCCGPGAPVMVTAFPAGARGRKFGLAWVVNPSTEWAPELVTGRPAAMSREPLRVEELSAAEHDGYAVLLVDLSAPASEVLESVRQLLPVLTKARGQRGSEHRRRRDKWRMYLRVLDAVGAGATPADIGTEFLTDDKQARQWIAAAKRASARICSTPK